MPTLTNITSENPHILEARLYPMNARACIVNYFQPENMHFPEMWQMVSSTTQGVYAKFITDSETGAYAIAATNETAPERADTPTFTWERYTLPLLKFNLSDEDNHNSCAGIRELYLNAAFYGSHVPRKKGNDEITPDPVATSQPIISEYLITKKFLLAKFTDVGKGFDLESCTQLGMGGDLMESSGRGLFLLKHFHGFDLQQYTVAQGSVVSAFKKFE